MKNHLNLSQSFGVEVIRPGKKLTQDEARLVAELIFGGVFGMDVFDKKGRRINHLDFHNGITDEGMTDLLDVHFFEGTQHLDWYFGLVAGTGTLSAADTLASHAGWTEFTNYTGDRKQWVPTSPAARAIGNSTTSDFAILGSGTLKGAFLAAVDTGSSGILWSHGLFGADQPVENGNTIKMSYALSG